MKASSFQVAGGVWHHVALVYDGKCLKIYVNGTFANQISMSGSVQSPWPNTSYKQQFSEKQGDVLTLITTPNLVTTTAVGLHTLAGHVCVRSGMSRDVYLFT